MYEENETRSMRFLKAYEYLDPKSARSFCEKIGVSQSTAFNYLNGKREPSGDFLLHMCKAYPQINIDWILDGTGEMLVENKPVDIPVLQEEPQQSTSLHDRIVKALLDQIESLTRRCASQEEEIERLKGLFNVD